MPSPAQLLRETADAIAVLGDGPADLEVLDDDSLLAAQRLISEHRRALDAYSSWVAAQLDHRSRRELGHSGLAARRGFVSTEQLIQSVTGSTRVEASRHIKVGAMMVAATDGPVWFAPVVHAVSAGELGADCADAIRRGLGEPGEAVTADALAEAAASLVSTGLDADQLLKRARYLRDALDAEGVAQREAERRDRRYLRVVRRPDGMVGGSFLLDPEDGGLFVAAIDAVTSPRRGGPRFVDPAKRAAAERLVNDPRTNDQLAADALVGMIRIAVDTKPESFVGGRPSVRVIVTAETLASRGGVGHIEGIGEAVSLQTVDRLVCDTGILGIKFDEDGRGINVGRDQRLFTERQRTILAIRDGGCLWPGCDRPPSWSEAHHINQWKRDHGRTDVDDGVLLCRQHHMLLHNNAWEVSRTGGIYWLRPPVSIDPDQELIELHSRTPEMQAFHRRAG